MFSFGRFFAVLSKEFLQLRRDRVTYAMILVLPVIQLLILGFAINTDPHHIPAAVLSQDHGGLSRALLSAIERTTYVDIRFLPSSNQALEHHILRGEALIGIRIPPDFSHRLLRGDNAQILVQVDASDPIAVSPALNAILALPDIALRYDLLGAARVDTGSPPFSVVVHRLYNPENKTSFNIVPGVLGIVLSLTLVMMTALAVTRERERGTMESLLATPITPLEMMLGKLTPYIMIGIIQTCVILFLADRLFSVPMPQQVGGWIALSMGGLLFVLCSLTVGYCISSFARNQLQAVQLSIFYILPSVFLSGFAFPFVGMPPWARVIGEIIPITHFLRIVRGTLLKGQQLTDIHMELAALILFALAAMGLSLLRAQRTLD